MCVRATVHILKKPLQPRKTSKGKVMQAIMHITAGAVAALVITGWLAVLALAVLSSIM